MTAFQNKGVAHLGGGVLSLIYRKDGSRSTEDFSGVEDLIRQLEEQGRLAMLGQDLAALERLWAEDFIVNDPQNQISSYRAAVLALVARGLIQHPRFERRIEAIRLHADLAIVMGAETVEPVGDAPRAGGIVERRFTNVWCRSGQACPEDYFGVVP